MPAKSAASQDFVSIRDIKDGVVITKSGQLCKVLLASSVNFALKSLDEQRAILFQFQNFLNTLDFTLQIYVQSRRLNIQPYIATLAKLEDKQHNDLMRIQLREYMSFIAHFTENANIMTKNFFVVIPYSPAKVSLNKGLASIIGASGGNIPLRDDTSFEEQRLQLEQRQGIVEQGLNRIGVRTIALQNDELVELFYHIYNPGDTTGSAPSMG